MEELHVLQDIARYLVVANDVEMTSVVETLEVQYPGFSNLPPEEREEIAEKIYNLFLTAEVEVFWRHE